MSSYSKKKSQNSCVHLFPAHTSLVIILFAFFSLFPARISYPADVTLTWDANVEDDLAGYRIYYREDGQMYDYNQPVWEGVDTVCTIYSLNDSIKYCFVARAFDTVGNESGDSSEVCFQESNNHAPTADAGPDQTVDERTTVILNGSSSSDSDYTALTYSWKQLTGTQIFLSDPASVQPTFVAPSASVTGEALIFELTVEDDGGLSDSDTVIINVSNLNQAPTANAGADQTVRAGDTVTLDASNSSDPDGSVVSYSWVQTAGIPITFSNTEPAQAIFTAPDVTNEASFSFKVTVFDDGGLRSEDTCIVNVSWVNVAPTADAGPDQTVDESVVVTLDGSNSTDSDGAIADYRWKQTVGTAVMLSDAASAQTTFLAPYASSAGEALTFELTVQDGGGLADTDTVIINVVNLNHPPVADAGPDQTARELSTVVLDGSNSSDGDGTVVGYSWSQIGGPPVTLSEPTAAQPIFFAPDVGPEGTSLSFQLTVLDELGLQSKDTCIVNVSWVNVAPTADAGPDQTVNEGVMVTLDGSNSTDSDGAIAGYRWKQTAGTTVTLSGAISAQATYLAPYANSAGEALTFELTVQDGGGLADTDTVIINVVNLNQPPVADAGDDQLVEDAYSVTLDSSESWDPDGDVVFHLWKQTDGTPVTLSDPRAVNPTFEPPRNGRNEVLKFQVTVTDSGELSSADNVDVNVYPSSGHTVQTIFDLQARAIRRGIRLGWSPVPEAVHYNIYRSCSSGGPYSQIGRRPANDTCTYLDRDILFGVTYYYLLRSVKGETESLDSNKASATLSNRGKS